MEKPQVLPENIERIDLPDLYDLLAEETVRFNRLLLQKVSKEELTGLKIVIKQIQEEIQRRKGIAQEKTWQVKELGNHHITELN